MKKITTKEYAEILYELTNNKSTDEIKSSLKIFTAFLVKNKSVSLVDEIEKSYVRLTDSKNNVIRGKITTAQKLNRNELEEINKNVEKIFNAKEVILQEIEDKKLIGGWKIKTENYLIDASVRGRIDKLGLVLTK